MNMKIETNAIEMLRKTGKAIESVVISMTDEQAKTLANECDCTVKDGMLCIYSTHNTHYADAYLRTVVSDVTYTLTDADVTAIVGQKKKMEEEVVAEEKEREKKWKQEREKKITENITEHPVCEHCCVENTEGHKNEYESGWGRYCDECAKIKDEIDEMRNLIKKENEIAERCEKIQSDITEQEEKLKLAEKVSATQTDICNEKIAKYNKLLSFAKQGYTETYDTEEDDAITSVSEYVENIPLHAMEKMQEGNAYCIIECKKYCTKLVVECYDTYIVIAEW